MASKTSVKLDKSLCDRAREIAEKGGYSSMEEFIQHVLERELAKFDEATTREEIEKKLKGLGYLE
jgi:Arc/MetJ-type ribon-helix-helix transcriptional regulator